jgi:hypothetical protein
MNFCSKCGQLQGELNPHGSKYHPHCYPDGTDGTMGKHIKDLYQPLTRIEEDMRGRPTAIRDFRFMVRLFMLYGNGFLASILKAVISRSKILRRLGFVAYVSPKSGFDKGEP